jgi:hypothetical protein
MCGKSCQAFKQAHALLLVTPLVAAPRVISVFKHYPTPQQIAEALAREKPNMQPVPFIYSERSTTHVVPIHIPIDILYG